MSGLPRLLTLQEVADAARISPQTVLRNQGITIPAGFKVGNEKWRWRSEDIQAWLDSSENDCD